MISETLGRDLLAGKGKFDTFFWLDSTRASRGANWGINAMIFPDLREPRGEGGSLSSDGPSLRRVHLTGVVSR